MRNSVVILLVVVLVVGMLGGLVACKANINENALLTDLGYSETLIADILHNRTVFAPGNKQIDQIVQSLPLQSYRKYNLFFLVTKQSKEINVVYEIDDHYNRDGNGIDPFSVVIAENNALILFATVEGLDKVNFLHYDDRELKELNIIDSYTIADLTARFGTINPLTMEFADLYNMLGANIHLSEFYFAHYSRIYLGVDQEHVEYRNGEPSEIKQQADGSTIWIYPDFGQIYSILPEGVNVTDPEYSAMYYFNNPLAEKNDNLTGLYATKFVHADNYGKSYEDITKMLGLPSKIKDMGDGNKYMAYLLAEGQKRNAYFILQNNKVIEEGVMYGDDYTTVH